MKRTVVDHLLDGSSRVDLHSVKIRVAVDFGSVLQGVGRKGWTQVRMRLRGR